MKYAFIDYAFMFVANFAIVFLLGLQSRNVVAGRYLAAVLTSLGISVGNFTFIKYAATGDPSAFVVCAFGGATGIACSIWFYEHVLSRRFAKGGILTRTLLPMRGVQVNDREASIPITPAMRAALSRGFKFRSQNNGLL